MTTEKTSGENLYFIDAHSSAEMARLINQDKLITSGIGGPLVGISEQELSRVQDILDIACGPGSWVMEVAFALPATHVVGFDISPEMIAYARAQARVQGLNNAEFHVMDMTQPFDFPGESFDLVNARLASALLPPAQWPPYLAECLRILRPGGILRLTEAERYLTNSPASEQLWELFTNALKQAGQCFSPNGHLFCLLPVLKRQLRDAGCTKVQERIAMINFSAGEPNNPAFYQNIRDGFKLMQPFLLTYNRGLTIQELETCYQQTLEDMQSESFCGVNLFNTAWGYKPVGG
jgi:ubiquinone/menaquinone biosynthesis C-methylase UbiE